MNNTIALIITLILMLPGLAGVLLPAIPGVPYMFVIATIYGLLTGFSTLTLSDFWWLGAIAAISVLIDYLAGMLGAKFAGAGKKTILIGMLALAIGTIVLPPFGGIIFMFVAILLSELWLYGKKESLAIKAATSSVISSVWGIVLNLMLAIGFIILFGILALS